MAITKLLCKPWAFGKPQVPSVMAEMQVAGFQEGPFGARCCKRLQEQAPVWPQTNQLRLPSWSISSREREKMRKRTNK